MITHLFALLFIYQIKHFLADYIFQGRYMLGKFKADWGFVKPLLAHVGVHGAMTVLIALVVSGNPVLAFGLGLLDAGIHFVMDRIKASPKYMGRWKPLNAHEYNTTVSDMCKAMYAKASGGPLGDGGMGAEVERCQRKLRGNRLFWISLGLDQMVHHLTHYLVIALLLLS